MASSQERDNFVTHEEFATTMQRMWDDISSFKDGFFKTLRDEILSIEDVKNSAKLILKAKEMNIEELVKKATRDAVKQEVNGKLDKINSVLNEHVNREDEWHETHEDYHKENEHKWGLIARYTKAVEERPLKVGVMTFVYTAMFLAITISDIRHPIFNFLGTVISHLWTRIF